MIDAILMYWWGIALTQPWIALGIVLICAVIMVALMFSLTYGVVIVVVHDCSIQALWNGMKMGFVNGLKFQWEFAVIIFALIVTVGTISSFTSK